MNITPIDSRISVMPSSEVPFLSSDIIFVRLTDKTVIFDVGRCDEAFEAIENVEGKRIFVISHFHKDHMTNLSRITLRTDDLVYCGSLTAKKAAEFLPADRIVTVTEDIALDTDITIFPIPSSHEKGSLGLRVGNIAFTGDATYATQKDECTVFNTSLLHQTIEVLKNCPAEYFYQSHSSGLSEKNKIIRSLEYIYSHRNRGEAYIVVSM